MKIVLTKRQFYGVGVLLGVVIFTISMSINILYLVSQPDITIFCNDSTQEVYNKSELNSLKTICGGVNIYKYNDNTGLRVYFPSKQAVLIAYEEYTNTGININISQ